MRQRIAEIEDYTQKQACPIYGISANEGQLVGSGFLLRVQDDKWDRFVIYRIKHVRYLKDLETLLISLLNPPGNSVEGRVPRDADINRILRRVLKEQEVSINKIREHWSGERPWWRE